EADGELCGRARTLGEHADAEDGVEEAEAGEALSLGSHLTLERLEEGERREAERHQKPRGDDNANRKREKGLSTSSLDLPAPPGHDMGPVGGPSRGRRPYPRPGAACPPGVAGTGVARVLPPRPRPAPRPPLPPPLPPPPAPSHPPRCTRHPPPPP